MPAGERSPAVQLFFPLEVSGCEGEDRQGVFGGRGGPRALSGTCSALCGGRLTHGGCNKDCPVLQARKPRLRKGK